MHARRRFLLEVVSASVPALVPGVSHSFRRSPLATQFADASQAAGAVRLSSLSLTGSVKNFTSGQRSLLLEASLPARCNRVEEDSFTVTRAGFSGSKPFFSVEYKAGAKGVSGMNEETFLRTEKARLARLLLGLGVLYGPLDLRATNTGSHGLHVIGPDGFDCIVQLSSEGETESLRYDDMATFFVPPPPGERQPSRRVERSEITTTFGERRKVGGFVVPFLITTSAKSYFNKEVQTTEEIKLTNALVNTPIDASHFQ